MNPNSDGGMTSTTVKHSATPATRPRHPQRVHNARWRQWGAILTSSLTRAISTCSSRGSPFATEAWTLGFYKQTGNAPTASSPLTQVVLGGTRPGMPATMTAPMVRLNVGSNKFTLKLRGQRCAEQAPPM